MHKKHWQQNAVSQNINKVLYIITSCKSTAHRNEISDHLSLETVRKYNTSSTTIKMNIYCTYDSKESSNNRDKKN